MPVTLINPSVGPRAHADARARTLGFIETRMRRNLGTNDRTFTFIDVASWESLEFYRAAIIGFEAAAAGIPGLIPHPGLFETVVHGRGTAGAGDGAPGLRTAE